VHLYAAWAAVAQEAAGCIYLVSGLHLCSPVQVVAAAIAALGVAWIAFVFASAGGCSSNSSSGGGLDCLGAVGGMVDLEAAVFDERTNGVAEAE